MGTSQIFRYLRPGVWAGAAGSKGFGPSKGMMMPKAGLENQDKYCQFSNNCPSGNC
jgi:hypothetical protein